MEILDNQVSDMAFLGMITGNLISSMKLPSLIRPPTRNTSSLSRKGLRQCNELVFLIAVFFSWQFSSVLQRIFPHLLPWFEVTYGYLCLHGMPSLGLL